MSASARKHVALVVENVPFGTDPRLRKQVADLLDVGCRVSVVSMRDPSHEALRTVPGLTVLEYPVPPQARSIPGYVVEYGLSFGWAALLLLRIRCRQRIDTIQFCQPPDVYFPLAWVLKKFGSRIVVDQRDLMPEILGHRTESPSPLVVSVLHWLERRCHRLADESICVNEYLRDRIVAAGADPRRVTIVRNGPVLRRTTATAADPSLKMGGKFLVCWVGKMGVQDRVDLVVDVAEQVVRTYQRTDCRFVLVGNGECLEELRAAVNDRGLARWVAFPGWLSEPEVFAFLATADLGIDTSLQAEVSPVKALEYMAFSLPIVCFDLPETRRICEGAAVLVQPPDVASVAKAVVTLLDDPAQRNRLGVAGRQRMHDELAWEHQSESYLSVMLDSRG